MVSHSDLEQMDSFELWKLGVTALPMDFNSIEDVDNFYNQLIECLDRLIECGECYEWERKSLIKRKEAYRNLKNPFYQRTHRENEEWYKREEKVIMMFPRL